MAVKKIEFAEVADVTDLPKGNKLAIENDILKDLNIPLTIVAGSVEMSVQSLFELRTGEVFELSENGRQQMTIMYQDKPLACGVLVSKDNKLGIQITEVM